MKICLIYPHLPPVVDGVGDYTCHLARELAAQGAEVVVTAACAPGEVCHVRPVPERVLLDRSITRWGLRGLPELVRKVGAAGCDVVSIQYTPFAYTRGKLGVGINLLPHLLRSRVKARVALTLHEPWIPFTVGPRRWVPAAWQRLATGWMVGACHHVIVTTERRRRQIQRLMFPSGAHVAMIPVGANIPCAQADREEARCRLGAAPEETLFATFGTTLPHRDFAAAYRCLRRLRDDGIPCRLVNIGKVTNQARLQVLNRLEQELGLEEQISWTGYHDAATVSAFLQAADVYLGPDHLGVSTRQTSLMAGLLHHLPVVGWRGPETDPLLERSGAIAFSEAGDEKGLGEAMKAAATSPAVRASMGARGRELFDKHFSWRQIAQRTLKLYSRT